MDWIKPLLSALLSAAVLMASRVDVPPPPADQAAHDPNVTVSARRFSFDGGNTAATLMYAFGHDKSEDYIVTLRLPGTEGTVRWYDTDSQQWHVVPAGGTLPIQYLYVTTTQGTMFIAPPFLYRPAEHMSRECQMALVKPLEVVQTGAGLVITARFAQRAGLEGHLWYIRSDKHLIEWTEMNERLWGVHLRLSQRWLYYGYYYYSPATYRPTGPGMFWRSPGSHWPVSLVRTGGSVLSDQLGYMMMSVIADNQSPGGYWLSEPLSLFVRDNAGIGPGFYDTRFNHEMAETLFIAWHKHGEPRFLDAAVAAADYILKHAGAHHRVNRGPDGTAGWLAYDYGWPGGGAFRPVWTSLNHQLQTIYTLLTAYAAAGHERHLDMAWRLIHGLRNVGDAWIRADGGGLHYAVMPDGRFGFTDYPFLTYNDLVRHQAIVEALGFGRDDVFDRLIDAKRAQMERDGITGYRAGWTPYFPRPG
jgi:hypothetical protein